MVDKDGNKLNVGDFVLVNRIVVPGAKGLTEAVVNRFDEDGSIVLVCDWDDQPLPIVAMTKDVRIARVSVVKKRILRDLSSRFTEMSKGIE